MWWWGLAGGRTICSRGATVITFYIYLKPRLTRPQSASRPASSFHVTRDAFFDPSLFRTRPNPFHPISRPTVGRSPITPFMCDHPCGPRRTIVERAWGGVGRQLRLLKAIFAAEARNVAYIGPGLPSHLWGTGPLTRCDSRSIRMADGGGVLALLEAISRMPLACLSPALGLALGGVSSQLSPLLDWRAGECDLRR